MFENEISFIFEQDKNNLGNQYYCVTLPQSQILWSEVSHEKTFYVYSHIS